MIKASAKVVDRAEADKLVVEVTFRAPVGELRELAKEIRRLNAPADSAPAPHLRWPLSEFVAATEKLVERVVDRIDNVQASE